MSFHDSRRSLSVDEWQAPVDTAEPDVGETANAGGEEYTERFSQSVKDRLTLERSTVIGCSEDVKSVTDTGQRIAAVSECVTTRLCPNTTAPNGGPPPAAPAYCANFRAHIRSTISSQVRPAATAEEAMEAAEEWEKSGVDGLVLRVPEVYRHNRMLYEAKHPQTVTVVQRLLTLAYFYMTERIEVIPDKAFTPDNGDKRSYVSLATYCWPSNPEDLKNPKGPWTCKDGLPFPGRNIIAPDFEKLMGTQNKVLALASAWYISRNEEFAASAAATLRAFFTDPETGMLPHLVYAQLRAGSKKGAHTGTIDNHATYAIFDAAALLADSQAWTKEDHAALVQWFSEYIHHLQSDHCKSESLQENNHGTYFDVQYLSVLSFLGRRRDAIAYIEKVVEARLRRQITGSVMATEMTRPKSYSYHSFILEGYLQLAMLAQKFDVNLWDMGAESGNSLIDAWDWMVPHWCDRSESIWPVEQIDNPKLDLNRPQEYTGALYTHVTMTAGAADAYTLRSRQYALLYQSLRGGPDPKHEMDQARALVRQLGLVKFDDCFIKFCPDREVKPVDPPSYRADNCIPAPDVAVPALDATKGPFWHVQGASDILPKMLAGDPRGAVSDYNTWIGTGSQARAAQMRYIASTHVTVHSTAAAAVVLSLLALFAGLAVVRRRIAVPHSASALRSRTQR